MGCVHTCVRVCMRVQGLGGCRVGAASRPSREGPSIQAAEQGQPRGLARGGGEGGMEDGKGALGRRAFPLAAQCRPLQEAGVVTGERGGLAGAGL